VHLLYARKNPRLHPQQPAPPGVDSNWLLPALPNPARFLASCLPRDRLVLANWTFVRPTSPNCHHRFGEEPPRSRASSPSTIFTNPRHSTPPSSHQHAAAILWTPDFASDYFSALSNSYHLSAPPRVSLCLRGLVVRHVIGPYPSLYTTLPFSLPLIPTPTITRDLAVMDAAAHQRPLHTNGMPHGTMSQGQQQLPPLSSLTNGLPADQRQQSETREARDSGNWSIPASKRESSRHLSYPRCHPNVHLRFLHRLHKHGSTSADSS
jgi:hypothetical protein